MSIISPIVLVLGAGPNVGQAIASTFTSNGYKVALAARSVKEVDSTSAQLNITGDFSDPGQVVAVFDKVKKSFGIPSVVVYNASAAVFTPADDLFALSLEDLTRVTNINVHSAFVAAQQEVLGFAQLPVNAARTFIYTGNVLNVAILPKFVSQGIVKFYYADERKPDGAPKYRISGDAHAKLFLELAHTESQGQWMQTFVEGIGYKSFSTPYHPVM